MLMLYKNWFGSKILATCVLSQFSVFDHLVSLNNGYAEYSGVSLQS